MPFFYETFNWFHFNNNTKIFHQKIKYSARHVHWKAQKFSHYSSSKEKKLLMAVPKKKKRKINNHGKLCLTKLCKKKLSKGRVFSQERVVQSSYWVFNSLVINHIKDSQQQSKKKRVIEPLSSWYLFFVWWFIELSLNWSHLTREESDCERN